MDYKELSIRAHKNAVNHGFWDVEQHYEHYLMLVLTEIAEAVEGDRKGNYFADAEAFEKYEGRIPFDELFERYVKNTVEDELADVAIRLLDLAGARKVRIVMKGLQWKFDKTSFTENAYRLCQFLVSETTYIDAKIIIGIKYIERWAAHLGKNLEWHIVQKMRYNENRPCRHGKKY